MSTARRGLKSALRPLVKASESRRPAAPPDYWGLEALPGQGLCLEGVSLHGLLRHWGSPLHVVHARRLEANVQAFRADGNGRPCEVFYSYKTNPIPGVLRFLHDRGVGAEIISPFELWLAFRLGVPAERIVYNGPARSDDSLREAITRGVGLINANHAEEVPRLARLAAEVGRRARMGLRVVTSDGWGGQFGIDIQGDDALRAYGAALAEPSLDVRALHVHRGVLIRNRTELGRVVDPVLRFADELHRQFGLDLEVLDLGGSLGMPSVKPLGPREQRLNRTFQRGITPPLLETTLPIASYVEEVGRLVDEHYRSRGRPRPRVFMEPGRALTGNAQMLLTSVVGTKRSGRHLTYAILDAGINVAEQVKDNYHRLFPVNRFGEPTAGTYRLAGPLCTPADVLYPACELPALEPGDSLAIMDAGAYFVPFSSSFSFPRPAVVMVENGAARLLRRAEGFEDMVSLDG